VSVFKLKHDHHRPYAIAAEPALTDVEAAEPAIQTMIGPDRAAIMVPFI